jgi:SAM-dependent methyltransferase
MVSLSVLVPVYNEQHLVSTSLDRLEILTKSPVLSKVQVIVVDDCSKDATPEVLKRFEASRKDKGSKIEWLFLRHEKNGGKGKAIQTALARATCDVTVIHDADLEYHPEDLLKIVEVFDKHGADAVFGSRFAGSEVRRVLFYRHELGNRLLTFLTNMVTDLNLTDMETCYKAVRTELLKSIPIKSNDFRLEPELTIKLAKRGARLFEVPISYYGRTYQEGKKIGWRDGVKALGAIARFAVTEDIYTADEHGSQTLARLSAAPKFNQWMADTIRPYLGKKVLEIGSGTGHLTAQLVPRHEYVATEDNPLYLHSLRALESTRPYLKAQLCDVTKKETFPKTEGGFDTVVCMNTIEHVEDDVAAMENIRDVLAAGGRAVVMVPRGQKLYGTLDEVLGLRRRYEPDTLRALAERAGFEVKEIVEFNRAGMPAWWLNSKLLRRRRFGTGQIHALNALTPIFRELDKLLPVASLSLIAILEPKHAHARAGKRPNVALA